MGIDLFDAIRQMFAPVSSFFFGVVQIAVFAVISAVILFLGWFFIKYRINPFKMTADGLRIPFVTFKYHDLLRWLLVDFLERKDHAGEFREYGFTFFVGRQGAGKTVSMVHYLEKMRVIYPNCMIITNFKFADADYIMKDWNDILNVRNGTDGIIFAIDEIQSEYSSAAWKNVPESLLSEISQQRKQRVKIVATAQFYSRVAKPLREQANTVVACSTFKGRFTRNKEYDAVDYAVVLDNPNVVKKKLRPLSKSSFVQSDALRACFDTWEKIERMQKIDFIPRNERGPQ